MLQSILFLPLLSSIIIAFFSQCKRNAFVMLFSALCLGAACTFSLYYLFQSYGNEGYVHHIVFFSWIECLKVNWAIYADKITILMYFVVTTVSFVVHVYSIGYMREDEGFNKFISYLSLFTFCMLVLVSADNLLQLFVGWEGVGFCSYILIGFWYKKESACSAANKAFIVNRIADLAIIIAMMIIFNVCDSLNFTEIEASLSRLNNEVLVWGNLTFNTHELVALLLFIGCMGKSAQLGLHVWLPDAMEGPTPVSALIHAATMVTAGVFLIIRLSFIFSPVEYINNIIIIIGSLTAMFGALVAITQSDIKKVIAYSTCSQLGYMFIACGLKSYNAAMFHLVTHAFFKSMLFLCAGSIIHATHTQDLKEIRQMGGVTSKMKFTFLMLLIGSFAIMGVPPFSGYYSKDLILDIAYEHSAFAYIFGIAAVFYTAFYSFKILTYVAAWGYKPKDSYSSVVSAKIHEADRVMFMPMTILLIGSIVLGYICFHFLDVMSVKAFLGINLDPYSIGAHNHIHDHIHDTGQQAPYLLQMLPLILSALGAFTGYFFASRDIIIRFDLLSIIRNKFYFDEIYDYFFVSAKNLIAYIVYIFDLYFVEKFCVNGMLLVIRKSTEIVKKWHTGHIYLYNLYIMLFLLDTSFYFIFKYFSGI